MKFELELSMELIIKYARHLGYEENELWAINEDESFKDTIVGIIEDEIDIALS